MHSIVREALLSWNDSFVRKKRKKAWRAVPGVHFGQFGKKEIGGLSNQVNFHVHFWEWVGMYIGDSYLSTLDFTDWLSSKRGGGVTFCVPLGIVWLFNWFAYIVYTFVWLFIRRYKYILSLHIKKLTPSGKIFILNSKDCIRNIELPFDWLNSMWAVQTPIIHHFTSIGITW